jgi:formylglycine-generating enzyme required for sulfatase activity
MLFALKLKSASAAAALAGPLAATTIGLSPVEFTDDLAIIAPKQFVYRLAGDFSQAGRPIDGPLHAPTLSGPLHIMKNQVTASAYQRCADDGACTRLPLPEGRKDVPIVGVSWHDASAYAAWITKKTGKTHRLPTNEEWTFAAAEKARDEAPPLSDPADPAQAWIARYEAEAARAKPGAVAPQPIGSFGVNTNGLKDLAGNVWEWTNTCFVRASLDDGKMRVTNTNCGVRVVAGAHRTYMTDFIRDPRTGGCAAGVPPANLGFRLVVEPDPGGILDIVSRAAKAFRG